MKLYRLCLSVFACFLFAASVSANHEHFEYNESRPILPSPVLSPPVPPVWSDDIRIPSIYKLVFGDVRSDDVSIQKTGASTITVTGNLTVTGTMSGSSNSGILLADNFTGSDICIKAAAAQAALPATGGIVRFANQNYAACAGTAGIGISMPNTTKNVTLQGAGKGNPNGGTTGGTTLNFAAGITGIDIACDRCAVEDLFLLSASSGAGTDDGIRVRGGAAKVSHVSVKGFGRDGVRIDSGAGSTSADLSHLEDVEANNNFEDGFRWAGPTCPDNHVIFASSISAVSNNGWGINVLCGLGNTFINPHIAANLTGGVTITSASNYFFNTYMEANGVSSFVIQTGAADNRAWFAPFGQPTTITNSGGSSNVFFFADAANQLVQNNLAVAPLPGSAGATTYQFGSGGYANSDLSIFDSTNSANLFHYNPTTKWEFLQRVLTTSTATLPALKIGSVAGDPSTLVNGDVWYDSTGNKFRCRENGASTNCIGAGGGGTVTTTGSPANHQAAIFSAAATITGVPGTITGSIFGATNAADPSFKVPGVPGTDVNAATYTVQCDSATTMIDRATTVRFVTTTPTVTMPDPTASGCGSNFPVTLIASGVTVTVNSTSANLFDVYNGTSTSLAQSSFSLLTGQFATLSSPSNTNWIVRIPGGGISGLTTGFIPKAAGASSLTNSLCDDGITTANTLTCSDPAGITATATVQAGPSPPACIPGTTSGAGFWCANEGTEFTNVAAAGGLYPDSTQHEYFGKTNGASTKGMMVRVQPGIIHQTAQTAAISTATLCASAAGACNTAGNYTVEWAFTQTGTACGTPGTGGVTFLLTWTDQNGTAHSAISLSMDDAASLVATTGTFHFTTSHATAWATGAFNLSSNGSIIQYATGYTACSVGTGSYQLDAWVTRKI